MKLCMKAEKKVPLYMVWRLATLKKGMKETVRLVPGSWIAISTAQSQGKVSSNVRRIKGLSWVRVCSLAFLALIAASTFADQWTRRSTASRQNRREVSLQELENLLRNRSRGSNTGRPAQRRRSFASALMMPVLGVTGSDLQDSFGDARNGGRSHMGIDIFAPRWTEVVAATAGTLTAIDVGPRSGRSLWLVGHDGRSYFYAHLQAWADGVFNGKNVAPGELIGYVGNTGNASAAPPHLHFEIRDNGRVINPFPILADAEPVSLSPRFKGSRSDRELGGN